MAKFLKALAIIALVLGIIGSIILAINLGTTKVVSSTIYDTTVKTKTDVGLLFGIMISGFLSSTILFAVLYGLSSIIEKLEYHDKKFIEMASMLEKKEGR